LAGFGRREALVRGGGALGTAALALGVPAARVLAAPAPQSASGTLRLQASSEPDTIDPQRASFVTEIDKVMRVFRNLLTFDRDLQLVPDQAADFPVVEDGGRLLTFTLKPDLVYSDGRPLTARDFEFGWKRHLDPATRGDYAFTGYAIAGGEAYHTADPARVGAAGMQALRDAVGVAALDDLTLQFRLAAPAPWFLSVLATWCGVPTRQDLIAAAGERWTEPGTYVGNGPYVLAEWDHQQRMRFTANPRFHPAPPPIAAVEYAIIPEPAVAFAAYLNGELDVVGVQRQDRPVIDGDRELRAQFHQYPGSSTFYVGFNTTRAPFDNHKVRAAFSFAFDRTGFVRTILGGQGVPARQFVPPGFPGRFDVELEEQTFNPLVGQRLLAEAGFPAGRGLPPIAFGYSADARTKVRIEALTEQLRQHLGVAVQPEPIEPRAYAAALKEMATTPQMFMLAWRPDYPDPRSWYSTVFHSQSAIQHSGYSNPEFDRLVELADAEPDPDARREQYRQAAQILINDVPVAFLYHSVQWVLVRSRVQGFREDPMEYFLGEHDLYNLRLTS
jgi:oligopeptide transport system substrate-binding protein